MTKAEFVALVAKKTKLTSKDTEATLNAVLAQITELVSKGQDVPFIGFGSFKVSTRKARTGRNPATGKEIKIPAKKVVTFKVGSKLKDAAEGKKAPVAKKGKK
jgi:DNA-binding protein HU-beta